MFIVDRLSKKICNEMGYDKEKCEVIQYGLFALFQITASLTLVLFFGWLCGVFSQVLIVSFTSNILRQYSGGVHASRPSICLIIGTIVTVGLALMAHLLSGSISDILIVILGLIFFILSYYIIYKRAPIDSPAKPIKTEAKRYRMRRNSLRVLSAYFIIGIILIMINYYLSGNQHYIEYALCIYLAVVWQVFNLTMIGHRVLTKIDTSISSILFQ